MGGGRSKMFWIGNSIKTAFIHTYTYTFACMCLDFNRDTVDTFWNVEWKMFWWSLILAFRVLEYPRVMSACLLDWCLQSAFLWSSHNAALGVQSRVKSFESVFLRKVVLYQSRAIHIRYNYLHLPSIYLIRHSCCNLDSAFCDTDLIWFTI